MRTVYRPSDPHLYLRYYRDQVGGELPHFRGTVYQRGNGLGSLFGSIVRGVTPLLKHIPKWLKSGAKVVGKQAVKTGAELWKDYQAGEDMSTASKKRFREAGADLLEETSKRLRQTGKGIKQGVKRKRAVSSVRATKVKGGAVKKVRRTKQDIFN